MIHVCKSNNLLYVDQQIICHSRYCMPIPIELLYVDRLLYHIAELILCGMYNHITFHIHLVYASSPRNLQNDTLSVKEQIMRRFPDQPISETANLAFKK